MSLTHITSATRVKPVLSLLVTAAFITAVLTGGLPKMIRTVHANNTAQGLPFTQNWANTGLITTNDDWSGVPGMEGCFLNNGSVSTTGVDPQTILDDTFGAGTTTVDPDVIANQTATTITNGGVAEFHTTSQAGGPGSDPTIALQGSGTADAPFILLNLNTTGQSGINVSYNLRDIDCTADNSVQPVALQYRVGNTGSYTNLPAGFVADATTGPSICTAVTAVSTTLPVGAENQPLVQLRIITTNAAGSDEWVGIDDISIGGNGLPTLSINNVSQIETDGGFTAFNFTITLSATAQSDVTFDIATADGTATSGSGDYFIASESGKTIDAGNNATTFNVFVAGDTTNEPDETFFVNITNVSGANPGDTQGVGTILNDDQTITLIHTIQGSAEAPAVTGSVKIRGVVVGDYQGGNNLSGFFVQEEDADTDADPNTSEGIFVFDGSTPAVGVSVGDDVTVIGNATNFPNNTAGITELNNVVSVAINSIGNPLPTAAFVSLPVPTSAAADLEKFEGMRVNFDQTLYVTNVDDLGRFGEVTVSAAAPLLIPTNSIDPNDNPASGTSTTGNSNVAAVTAQQSLNDRSRLIIDDGTSKTNSSLANPLTPIPFLIGAGTNATLRRGDTISNPIAIMNFGFSTYRLEPAPTLTFTQANPRPAAPSLSGGNVRIASYNVENYFVDLPGPGGRGASNAAELTRQRDKLVQALAALNADVIGLVELQKSNGTAAATDLANALTALGTVGTWQSVDDLTTLNGTDPDIKNGMIYRTDTVTPFGTSFTDTVAPVGDYSRDPLAQIFKLNSTNRAFAVVVHHARSKSCSGAPAPPDPDADLGDGQACFNDRRRNQSFLLRNFVDGLQTTVEDVLVVGDFNSYGEEDPIDVFRAGGYTDVIGQFVAAASKYSFTFNGEAGQLDHAFASTTLGPKATDAAIWHINADEPDIFDYNTESKPDDRYAATPYRSADHDPIVASFNLLGSPTADDATITGTITDDNGAPVVGAVVQLTGTQNRKTITNANGVYRFDGVETSGFYTVSPSRVNYSFTPANRSFSQLGEQTEAVFNGDTNGETVNPLEMAEYFVRQQYVDLLNREPDEGGFNYWSDRILECGANDLCISARRRDVAAAFFIEQEFQQTGSFIYGLYKSALERQPGFAEYTVDRQQLVVGGELAAQKQALVNNFVRRPEFVARYQGSTSAQTFVDALLAAVMHSSGIDLQSERAALIDRYATGSSIEESRAGVVQLIGENTALRQWQYNSAFVLTEYFGYLRRDPDLGGYNFWLNVLNNREQGNFRGMVCAFITSAEYQQRFSNVISRTNADCGR